MTKKSHLSLLRLTSDLYIHMNVLIQIHTHIHICMPPQNCLHKFKEK